jgi:hypothetical protein
MTALAPSIAPVTETALSPARLHLIRADFLFMVVGLALVK